MEYELIHREGNKEVENRICNQLSKACKNVDVKDAPRMDENIFIDGQPVPIGADGSVNLAGKQHDEDDLW